MLLRLEGTPFKGGCGQSTSETHDGPRPHRAHPTFACSRSRALRARCGVRPNAAMPRREVRPPRGTPGSPCPERPDGGEAPAALAGRRRRCLARRLRAAPPGPGWGCRRGVATERGTTGRIVIDNRELLGGGGAGGRAGRGARPGDEVPVPSRRPLPHPRAAGRSLAASSLPRRCPCVRSASAAARARTKGTLTRDGRRAS